MNLGHLKQNLQLSIPLLYRRNIGIDICDYVWNCGSLSGNSSLINVASCIFYNAAITANFADEPKTASASLAKAAKHVIFLGFCFLFNPFLCIFQLIFLCLLVKCMCKFRIDRLNLKYCLLVDEIWTVMNGFVPILSSLFWCSCVFLEYGILIEFIEGAVFYS